MKKARAANSRERLLDAAEVVTIERGVNGLTLDAVATRAGVSKGGLLYHFPSKDAIVQAMVTRVASIVKERFEAELVQQSPGQGRHALTLLHLMMETEGSLFPRLQRLAAPLLAAMASNQQMLDPMRRFFKGVHQGMLSDGLSPDRSWLILAALDGLKYWKIFGLLQPSKRELAEVRLLITQIIGMK